MITMDWKFVLIQGILLFTIILQPNVASGLSAGALMLVLWRKKWDQKEAVIALFMLSCVLASSRVSGLQYWKTLRLLPAVLLFFEAIKVFRHAQNEQRQSWVKWVLIIISLTGVPALFSDSPERALEETFLLSSMWFIMLVTAQVQNPDHLSSRYNSLRHLSILVIGLSMVLFLAGQNTVFLDGRFRGIFGNPNELSHWMLPFVLLIVLSVFSTGRERRFAWLIGFGIFGLTGTRATLIALILSLIGIRAAKRNPGMLGLLSISVVLVIVLSQSMPIESFTDFLPEKLVRSESLSKGGGRFLAWEYAFKEIEKHPILGGGGGYEERYFGSHYDFFSQQGHQGLSHNAWLAFALNFGMISAVILILGLVKRLGLARKSIILTAAPAFLISLTVEGWLTAPMGPISPVLFFVGGLLGSEHSMVDLTSSISRS